jgi:DNA polymerase III subunit gamma/tau
MAYQVIARKYRPQQFQDVVGQEHVTQTLAHAIEQKRIAHAYLFCGPRGTGKTTIARIFAKALNCTAGPKADFDVQDPRCVEIAEGRSLDVLEIDGASNNGVEQVRELRETCRYAPASSRFKIYIIDEVHMLSTAAFNALLKTLEEPPGHVKFMFATTDPEKVLPTILSRCQRFDLRRIPVALITKHLAHVAKLEQVKIEGAALHAIARGSEGAMRDAESTLDQLISFCGNQIGESDVLSMFGLVAQSQLLGLARAILDGQVETALRQLNDLANNGKDLGRLVADLLSHFRNLLIFQVSRGNTSMLEVSEGEIFALSEQSKLVAAEGLTRILEVLADTEMRLRDAASKKILIEVALLKSIEARAAVNLDSVLEQLRALRESGGEVVTLPLPAPAAAPGTKPFRAQAATAIEVPGETAPTVRERPAPAPAAPKAAFAEAHSGEIHEGFISQPATALEELWARLLEAVGRASQFTRSYLLEAHPVSLKANVLTIGFDPEFEDHIGLVDNAKNHALLQTKLSELGHPKTQVKFVKAAAPADRPKAAPAAPVAPVEPAPKSPGPARRVAASEAPAKPKAAVVPFTQEEFKNDPLIQKALEIFKGQIVEVRA